MILVLIFRRRQIPIYFSTKVLQDPFVFRDTDEDIVSISCRIYGFQHIDIVPPFESALPAVYSIHGARVQKGLIERRKPLLAI